MTVTVDPTPEPQPVSGQPGRAERVWQSVSARAMKLYEWGRAKPVWMQVTAFLLVVTAVSVFDRTRQLGGQFWMDEGLTVGISSHPLTAIPGIMRMDGSPPLFYMLLHVWMSLFGNSETATHTLSLIFGTLTIPIGYWAGASLVNRRTGVFAALLFASTPFLTAYSQETRMYALMALLGLLATVGFVRGFVFRQRAYVALFSVSQALMIYTHSWGLFYGAASFVSLAILWRISGEDERRNFVKDAVFAYVGVAILYAPWLLTFIYQATHTAAPWDKSPRFGLIIQIDESIIGSNSLAVVAYLATAIGAWGLLSRAKRRSVESRVLYMLLGLAAFTFIFAWIASQITPAWVVRYFAPTVGPLLLLFAMGMARTRWIGVLAVIAVCTTVLFPGKYAPANKSDMRVIAGEVAPMLHPGDLVIVGQPEQTPLAYYYLPRGLRFANTQAGLVKDPTYMNWVNALKKYRAAVPSRVLPPLLNSLKPGQRVLYIQPLTEGNSQWIASWTELIRLRSAQWGAIIAADKQLKPIAWAPHNYLGACCVANSAVLYQKVP